MEKTIETQYGNFNIRPYTNEDEDAVLKLWQLAFKQSIDRRIWRWKFHNNPFGREMMLCVDRFKKPVVLFAGIPFPAQWNMKQIVMTQNVDNMSHPYYRHAISGRKGLFIQTAEHFFSLYGNSEMSTIHYGFPGKKHYKLGNLFLDYTAIPQEHFYYELSVENLVQKGFSISKKVKVIHEFNEKFDELWQLSKEDYPYSIFRNAEFLNWRFSQNPIRTYWCFGIFNIQNKLLGYMIFLLDGDIATIVDIFCTKDQKILHHLIHRGIKTLVKQKIKKVRIWISSNHFITKALVNSEFKPIIDPLGIVPAYRYYKSKIDLTQFDKFFYTMADGDLF